MDPKMATVLSMKGTKSKNVINEDWEKCLVNGGIKVMSGLALGT